MRSTAIRVFIGTRPELEMFPPNGPEPMRPCVMVNVSDASLACGGVERAHDGAPGDTAFDC